MEDEDMLTQPPESPRRDEEGQLYTQPPEETGEPPQRARFAFALVPERNVADVFCPQMADLVAMAETTVGRTEDNDIVLVMPDVPNIVPMQVISRRHCTFRTGRDESNRDACFLTVHRCSDDSGYCGVYVNDELIKTDAETRIETGTRIRFGSRTVPLRDKTCANFDAFCYTLERWTAPGVDRSLGTPRHAPEAPNPKTQARRKKKKAAREKREVEYRRETTEALELAAAALEVSRTENAEMRAEIKALKTSMRLDKKHKKNKAKMMNKKRKGQGGGDGERRRGDGGGDGERRRRGYGEGKQAGRGDGGGDGKRRRGGYGEGKQAGRGDGGGDYSEAILIDFNPVFRETSPTRAYAKRKAQASGRRRAQ
jgi:hypothetical protein